MIEGRDEFRQALRNLPQQLHDEAMDYVQEATTGAAADLKAAYPERAYGSPSNRGNLRKGVKTEFPSSQIAVGVVRSTSRHAHLYEYGTQTRRTATGANRGSSPAHPTLVPIAIRRRRRLQQQLVAMVKREGFEVSDAGG